MGKGEAFDSPMMRSQYFSEPVWGFLFVCFLGFCSFVCFPPLGGKECLELLELDISLSSGHLGPGKTPAS